MNNIRLEIMPTHVNVPTTLQIGGVSTDTLYQQRVWLSAIIASSTVNGPVTITAQSGAATLTSVTRTATGNYVLAWSPALPTNVYIVQGNVRNAPGYVSFNSTGIGGCTILTYNAAGAATDTASGCHFMIFRD